MRENIHRLISSMHGVTTLRTHALKTILALSVLLSGAVGSVLLGTFAAHAALAYPAPVNHNGPVLPKNTPANTGPGCQMTKCTNLDPIQERCTADLKTVYSIDEPPVPDGKPKGPLHTVLYYSPTCHAYWGALTNHSSKAYILYSALWMESSDRNKGSTFSSSKITVLNGTSYGKYMGNMYIYPENDIHAGETINTAMVGVVAPSPVTMFWSKWIPEPYSMGNLR